MSTSIGSNEEISKKLINDSRIELIKTMKRAKSKGVKLPVVYVERVDDWLDRAVGFLEDTKRLYETKGTIEGIIRHLQETVELASKSLV